jgi:hypothetical protein
MDISTSFILIIIAFDEAFKCDDGDKFCGYVETNTEVICVELYNSVQCHVFFTLINLLLNKVRKVGGLILSRTYYKTSCHNTIWSWGSSASIVTDYKLDERCLIPGTGKGFFL